VPLCENDTAERNDWETKQDRVAKKEEEEQCMGCRAAKQEDGGWRLGARRLEDD
jgi:hypothetical protein